jgi:hypothetical protein
MKGFLILASTLFPFLCTPAVAEIPDPDNLEKLVGGKILVLDSHSDKPGGMVRVQALAQVPAKAVWDVVVSCSQSFMFVDGLQSCDVIEDSGKRALLHQVTKQGWPAPTLDIIYESLRDPHRSIRFSLVKGNLQAMEGSWQLTEIPEGLLMDYEIRVKPELAAPDFMIRSSLRKSSPDMVACIRGLSGGSGSSKLEGSDLKRCPGKPDGDS